MNKTQHRKLGFYSIDFLYGNDHYFNTDDFCEFIEYMDKLPDEDKLFNDVNNSKAVSMANIKDETKQGLHLYKIVFKSCRYNHSPDYMSSEDGSERTTDKKLFEGEKELTHMCLRIDTSEAFTIFEERRNGVSIGGVIRYFNTHYARFLARKGRYDATTIYSGIIPSDGFDKFYRSVERINIAEIYADKKMIGSEYLGLMEPDKSMQDDFVITLKAKRGEGLAKRGIKALWEKITSGSEITRVRLYAKDIDKMNVILDSLHQKKLEEVIVDLREKDGTVDTYSIFARIEEVLGVTE